MVISGTDVNRVQFAEETETITISKFGAAVRSAYQLKLGEEVSLRTKDHDRAGQFVVVWRGKEGTLQDGLIGMEWLEPRLFWGVDFPPEDWGRAPK